MNEAMKEAKNAVDVLNTFFDGGMMNVFNFHVMKDKNGFYNLCACDDIDNLDESTFIREKDEDVFVKRMWTFLSGVETMRRAAMSNMMK